METKLQLTMTQSDVDDNFAMLVRGYGDFGKGMVGLGQLPVIGNCTRGCDLLLSGKPKKVAYNS